MVTGVKSETAWGGATAARVEWSSEPETAPAVAATPPKKTRVSPGTKFAPVSVTVVPPVAGPLVGLTLSTAGGAT